MTLTLARPRGAFAPKNATKRDNAGAVCNMHRHVFMYLNFFRGGGQQVFFGGGLFFG